MKSNKSIKHYIIIITSLFYLLAPYNGQSQNNRRSSRISLPVYFKEYNIEVSNFKIRDTIRIKKDSFFFKIFFNDYKGDCYFECYQDSSKLLAKGNYINSLGILGEYKLFRYANSKQSTYLIHSFYQPLRNDVWYFYDDQKKIFLNKIFKKGIESLSETDSHEPGNTKYLFQQSNN